MPVDVPISFELFPPRSDAAALALGRTIDRLAQVHPAFFSVTFGAGGSTRERSLTVLRYILEHTDVAAMAHFTCVGSSRAEVETLIGEFLDAGISSFLALRGDPPIDAPDDEGELASAAELVALILHSQRVRAAQTPVQVAVAAFPNGHPRDERRGQDIEALLAKQAAGATLAITQLFWRAEDYFTFVSRAREAGVSMEILPGIMPVTSLARLRRLEELTGIEAPAELVRALGGTDPAEAGIHYAARLVRETLTNAPGVHLYTFNQHETLLATLERV